MKPWDSDLEDFASKAEDWFRERPEIAANVEFVRSFMDPNRLAEYEWEDFKQLASHLTISMTMAVTRQRAFGQPNHRIDRYRESFRYLASGSDDLSSRIDRLLND